MDSRLSKTMLKGFKNFILRGNIVDLAVAVAVGGAFNNVVNALVKNIITPIVAALGGNTNFSEIYFTVNKSKIMVGEFLNSITSFLIMAFVIYFLVITPMNRIMEKVKSGQKVDPTEKQCPECLSQIPIKAKRCKYCTARV
jgi:large conductance mechanosensitive channel